MSCNIKAVILFLTIFSCILNSISGRDFSENLIQEYQQFEKRKVEAQTSKLIACVNLDILILLMPEAANFDLMTMRVITGDSSLFINDNFYQNWKRNLIGKTHTEDL